MSQAPTRCTRIMGLWAPILASAWLVGCAGCVGEASTRKSDDSRRIQSTIASLRATVEGDEIRSDGKPQVMILGTFHFEGSATDTHQSKYWFDVKSPEGQRQLGEVLDRLAAFAPTKIGIERNSDKQAGIDQWYAGYKAGNFPSETNEILTMGFALAQRLGHEKVYGIDAVGYWLPIAPADEEAYTRLAAEFHQEHLLDAPIDRRYLQMYDQRDEARSTMTLREQFLLLNDPEYVRLGHGGYLVGGFELGSESNFAGVDGFPSMWQHRNLRMFRNIQRLAASPHDRVLIIVGAGHLPLLRFNAVCCPTLELVPVETVLGE